MLFSIGKSVATITRPFITTLTSSHTVLYETLFDTKSTVCINAFSFKKGILYSIGGCQHFGSHNLTCNSLQRHGDPHSISLHMLGYRLEIIQTEHFTGNFSVKMWVFELYPTVTITSTNRFYIWLLWAPLALYLTKRVPFETSTVFVILARHQTDMATFTEALTILNTFSNQAN